MASTEANVTRPTPARKPARWPRITGSRFWMLLLFVLLLFVVRVVVVEGYGITLFMDEAAQRQNAIDMTNRILLEGQSVEDSIKQAAGVTA